jgi:hypothetical protein
MTIDQIKALADSELLAWITEAFMAQQFGELLTNACQERRRRGLPPPHIGKAVSMPLPSLPRQAASLTAALARTAKAAVTAQSVLAAPSTYASRAELCAACELWIPERKRCRKCGCRTDLKLRLAQERCPLGKWEKDDIA